MKFKLQGLIVFIYKKTQVINLSDNGLKVLERRYLLRNTAGEITETPGELFHRVAGAVAAAELKWGNATDVFIWEENFYQIMSGLLFLPNSPTLMNAGTDNSQLSACFVLPVTDSLDSIFTTLKQAALIQKSGGGTGFNFSHLRPAGDLVSGSGPMASGPVAFMKVFDTATEHIKQGGKRRGANMGILNIDHPDIEEFIGAKREAGVLNNFNISVGITDSFMKAVEENKEWNLINPRTKQLSKKVNAVKIWDLIIESAWKTGDPGLIFIDTINRHNPVPALGKIESTNPCGEVPLQPYEPCNLGSVNLSKFIKTVNGKPEVDWTQLEDVIKTAIRFLDNVIDVNEYIIPEIKDMAMGNRKIGLGVMGWAEMLIQLEIPYDSEIAVELAGRLMQFIQDKAKEVSRKLAEQRGVFLNWQKSIYFPWLKIRNATRTSIAPTGTISIIAGTSSSIEPLFALSFQRMHVLNNETLYSLNNLFSGYLQSHDLYKKEIMQQVIREGIAGGINELPAGIRNIFKTALEIKHEWHLRHQLAFQQYTDNAVSKTINLPETAMEKDIDLIYKTAWQQKAKGITIFRYHSKGSQVMQRGIQSGIKACKVCIE